MESSFEKYFRYLLEKYNINVKAEPFLTEVKLSRNLEKIIIDTGRIKKETISIDLDEIDKKKISDYYWLTTDLVMINNRWCYISIDSYYEDDYTSRLTISIN